ncbi:MAG: 30S ribosomal protein THX [Bacteroidota bacterium]
MGKGDKKTKRGKIFMGSYGVTRKRKKRKPHIIIKKKDAVAAKISMTEKEVKIKKVVVPESPDMAKPSTSARKKTAVKKSATNKTTVKKTTAKETSATKKKEEGTQKITTKKKTTKKSAEKK